MERISSDPEISTFILRACHDLRAAARAVRTHSELLLRQQEAPNDSDLGTRLGFIVDGARRIDLLLDGLAGYAAALETDPASFQAAPSGVLLRGVLAKLSTEMRECGAEVAYTDLPTVWGNPDRLVQVFEQLLRNALVHRGKEAPRVQISAAKHEDGSIFSVRDNGPGVETAYLETVFRPFERLAGKERPGAGLGLAIARAVVDRHGGRIWAESPDGGGASFWFTLPEP